MARRSTARRYIVSLLTISCVFLPMSTPRSVLSAPLLICREPPCSKEEPEDGSIPDLPALPHLAHHDPDSLQPGEGLLANQSISSPNGCHHLWMQSDSNLVIYQGNGIPIWSSNTQHSLGEYVIMQYDGNLVMYDRSGKSVWSTRTAGYPKATLYLQNDGNMVIYQAPPRSTEVVWQSGSVSPCFSSSATTPIGAPSYNVCYNLLKPIWHAPTFTEFVECLPESPFLCLVSPHCCLPGCQYLPDCIINRRVLDTPEWLETTTCEALPPEKVVELMLRGRLHVEPTNAAIVEAAVYAHIQEMKAVSSQLPAGIQSLLQQLLSRGIGSGMPSFTMEDVLRARIINRSAEQASVYQDVAEVFSGSIGAITLNDLVVMNDVDFNEITGSSIPAGATIDSLRSDGPLRFLGLAFSGLVHELVHVRQYRELGMDAFLANYFPDLLTSGGYPGGVFEGEAYAFQRVVEKGLSISVARPIVTVTPIPEPEAAHQMCSDKCEREKAFCVKTSTTRGPCYETYFSCIDMCP